MEIKPITKPQRLVTLLRFVANPMIVKKKHAPNQKDAISMKVVKRQKDVISTKDAKRQKAVKSMKDAKRQKDAISMKDAKKQKDVISMKDVKKLQNNHINKKNKRPIRLNRSFILY